MLILKFLFIFLIIIKLSSSAPVTASTDIIEITVRAQQTLDPNIITQLPIVDVLPTLVIDIMRSLRSLNQVGTINLLQKVMSGQLPSKIISVFSTLKSLSTAQLVTIINRKNINSLSPNILEALEFLKQLTQEQTRVIIQLKNIRTTASNGINLKNLKTKSSPLLSADLPSSIMFATLNSLGPAQFKLISLLRDLGCLPLNIENILSILKNLSEQQIKNLVNLNSLNLFDETVLKANESYQLLQPEQVGLLTKIGNIDATVSFNVLNAILLLNTLNSTEIFSLTSKIENSLPNANVLDLVKLLKKISVQEKVNIIKLVVDKTVPLSVLQAFGYLDAISFTQLNRTIEELNLNLFLSRISKKLDGLIPTSVLKLKDLLISLTPDQMNNLALPLNLAILSDRILEVIQTLKSLTSDQIQKLNERKNLGTLPANVLDAIDFLNTLKNEQVQMIENLSDVNQLLDIFFESIK